jgi:phosphoglycerol transferase
MLLAIGSSGVYYAYFTLCFVVLAALIAWWRERSSAHLASGAVAVGVLATSVLLSVLPFIAYRLSAGSNPSALERGAMGVEAYALRITQMLMPVPGHRIPVFARLTAMYTSSMRGVFGANVINENSSAAIGAVAAFGFLVLVAVVLGGSRRAAAKGDDRLWAAGSLSLAGILAATASGLGFFVGMALPQIRAYNRISIFLAFFSLFAAGYVLERALGRLRPTLRAGALPVVAFVLLAIGLFDQTTPAMVPAYAATAVAYRADELFVAQVERALPAGSTVLQLPYVPFPENPPVNKMLDYEHFKGYLHSAALKWSYGAVKGRAGAAAIAALSTMPVAQLVVSARSDGYAGIWVDREGYADGGVALVQGIAAATQAQPLISSDGRYVVFALQ